MPGTANPLPHARGRAPGAWPRPAALLVAVLTLVALVAAVGGCSGKDTEEQAYCDALKGVQTSFDQLGKVDVAKGGLEALGAAVDRAKASLEKLRSAAEAQFSDEVRGLDESLQELGTVLAKASLTQEWFDQAKAALDGVKAAWDQLVARATPQCRGLAPA